MTPHLYDVFFFFFLLFLFGALYFGRPFCIDIEYCIYGICGLWTVFVVWVYVYGYVFVDMYLWI